MKSEFLLFDPVVSPLGKITLCAQFMRNPGAMSRPWRRLPGFALVFILRGEGIFQKPGEAEEVVRAGSALWIAPGEDHFYSPHSDWDEFFILFEGKIFDLAQKEGVFPSAPTLTWLPEADSWKESFSDLFLYESRKERSDQTTMVGALFEKLLSLAPFFKGKPIERVTFLEKSQQWMNPYGRFQLDPQACAKRHQMSYSHFRHRFREEAGESPEKFRSRQRLLKACHLLREKKQSIKEIAHRLGYYDEFHFSKHFKTHIQYSPSVYQKMQFHSDKPE